jgi:hypothetical protein
VSSELFNSFVTGKHSDDEAYRKTIAAAKKRQEELDRQTTAQTALDRLFSKKMAVVCLFTLVKHPQLTLFPAQKEEETTSGMSEDSKKQRQQQIKEEKEKISKQSIELREQALHDYLK